MKKHWLLLPIATSTCMMPLVACGNEQKPAQDKFEDMYEFYLNLVLDTTKTDDYKDKTVDEIMAELSTETYDQTETYYFLDLDYDDQDPAIWQPHQHILRALQIAVLAQQRNDTKLMEIATKLTLYWLCNNYISAGNNWWFNEIGVPRDLSSLALIVYEQLSDTFKEKMIEWINHGTLSGCSGARSRTGTNLFWHAEISIKYCILTRSDTEFDLVISEVTDEIKEDDTEGFQSDGSYYQHGKLMYTGGYGRQGALMLTRILAATSIAGYDWPLEKLKIVTNFILNGVKYFTHKDSFNYSCMGRTYTRKTSFNTDAGITDLGNIDEFRYILDVQNLPEDAATQIQTLLDCWRNNESAFTGVKYFPKSCFITMNLDDIYMSFKGTMTDLINCEKTNGENELAYNMSYGTNTCVMETGNEYNNIVPVWDYSYLPGTTSIVETDAQLKERADDIGTTRNGLFAGGKVENENVVVSMQKTTHGYYSTTHLQVTCFGTNDGMVILGSNMVNDGGEELHTTVEQCTPNYPVSIEDDNKVIVHSKVAYTNLMENSTFDVDVSSKSGNWARNNNTYIGEEDVQGEVLTITVNNDSSEHKDRYAYAIQPSSMKDRKFEVIINDNDYHAILLPGGNKIAAAFYSNGSFTYEGQEYSGEAGKYYVFDKI